MQFTYDISCSSTSVVAIAASHPVLWFKEHTKVTHRSHLPEFRFSNVLLLRRSSTFCTPLRAVSCSSTSVVAIAAICTTCQRGLCTDQKATDLCTLVSFYCSFPLHFTYEYAERLEQNGFGDDKLIWRNSTFHALPHAPSFVSTSVIAAAIHSVASVHLVAWFKE